MEDKKQAPSTNTKKDASSTGKKTDSIKVILIILVLLLLGGVGYFGMSHAEKSEKLVQQQEVIKKTQDTLTIKVKELRALQLEYERIKLEREALGLETDSLDQVILQLNQKIVQVRAGNAATIRNLNRAVVQLKAGIISQDSAISALKRQRDSLYAHVDTLRREKGALSDTIGVLKTQKSELSQKVELASILRAENIQVVSINKKGKESLPIKPDLKAKSIDKLKVTFNLADNQVAKQNQKQIMLRVVEPNGAVLFDLSTGGGFFMSEGKEVPYTSKEEVSFDNSKQKVSFLYMKGSPYKPGNYTIEIYGDGNKIGDKRFLVK